MEDDEPICPWLYTSDLSHFYSQGSLDFPVSRCQSGWRPDHVQCNLHENIWFCDLRFNWKILPRMYENLLETYHILDRTEDFTVETIIHSTHLGLISTKNIIGDTKGSTYHRGYPIESLQNLNEKRGPCSSSYHGNHCQYQSEQLTVYLRYNRPTIFNLKTIFVF